MACIIYIFKKYRNIVEKLFLAFAIPVSIAFAFFILPQNVPDEGTHIMKAYDISIGHIFTQFDENGDSYSTIIDAISNFSYMHFRKYQDVTAEFSTTTDYNDQKNIICAAQGNFPILYLGTATSFVICRTLNINYLYAIYLGRLFNVIIFLLLGYLSIKKIPFGKLVLAIYLCMPMMLQQAASFSADAILNATIMYFISHLIYMVFKEDKITKNDKIILYILTAFVAMFKYIYILLAGVLFIRILSKKEERKENLKTAGIMIIIGSVFLVGWFLVTLQYKSVPPAFEEYNKIAHVNNGEQISFIKEHPLRFIKIFIREYLVYGSEYIFGAVGSTLGWLEIEVDKGVIATYIILLLLAAISEENKYEISVKSKIWIASILLVISAMLNLVMYITFTPVGMDRIAGVQGRYYTPILILAFLCFIKKDNNWKVKNVNEKLMTISAILNMFALYYVLELYL